MPFPFTCTECGQLFSVSASKIGMKLRCPKCEVPITVPTQEEAAEQIVPTRAADQEIAEPPLPHTANRILSESAPPREPPQHEMVLDSRTTKNRLVAVPRGVIYLQGALLGIVGVVAFFLGTLFGALGSRSKDDQPSQGPYALHGQISLTTSAGRMSRDAGSTVMALPRETLPDEKLEIVGLRAGDSALPPEHPTVRALHVFGGAIDRTDEQGSFRLYVPRRGSYFLLVLSAGARRARDDVPRRKDLAELGRYVTSASDLLGDQQYRWTEENIKSDVKLDWVFDLPTD